MPNVQCLSLKTSANAQHRLRPHRSMVLFCRPSWTALQLGAYCSRPSALNEGRGKRTEMLGTVMLYGCLFQPLFTFTWYNLQVTYSCVFGKTHGAHTLLGPVIQLFIPASVHLNTDKPAGDLLWTNPRVVWEYPYSDQWEPSNITRLIRIDQSHDSKFVANEQQQQ